jgi:hypothetical protein
MLVRSTTRREPEFNEEDRAWFLALAECRALTCGGCGQWLPESTDSDAEDYFIDQPYRCGACTAMSIAQETYTRGYNGRNPHMQATKWSAERRHRHGEPHGHSQAPG